MFTVWQTFSTDGLAPTRDDARFLARFEDRSTAQAFAFNAYEVLAPRQAYWMETEVVVTEWLAPEGASEFNADAFGDLTLDDLVA